MPPLTSRRAKCSPANSRLACSVLYAHCSRLIAPRPLMRFRPPSKGDPSIGLRAKGIALSELTPIVDVTDVRVLARYVVELTFADGAVRVIDLEPCLSGPIYEPIRSSYDVFRRVTVDADSGTIVWPNGADISPRTLYRESKPVVPA